MNLNPALNTEILTLPNPPSPQLSARFPQICPQLSMELPPR